jgi:hypothetical protein
MYEDFDDTVDYGDGFIQGGFTEGYDHSVNTQN